MRFTIMERSKENLTGSKQVLGKGRHIIKILLKISLDTIDKEFRPLTTTAGTAAYPPVLCKFGWALSQSKRTQKLEKSLKNGPVVPSP